MNIKSLSHSGGSASPNYIDKLLSKSLLRFFPSFVTPNHITIFRYLSIPFIIYFLVFEYYLISFIIFLISGFSDILDGSLARTRNKITDWGKINDPLADKVLIGSVAIILITNHISLSLALFIIFIEAAIMINALHIYNRKNKVFGALLPGKIKMGLQSLGLIFLFIYSLSFNGNILYVAELILYVAIFFALISLFVYKSI